MTAVSLSISRGNDGLRQSDFTVGTSAPGTGDFEFRWNQTSNSVDVTRKDLNIALRAFITAINESGGVTVSTGVIGPP